MRTDHYEVSMELTSPDLNAEEVEELLVRLVDLLAAKASGLALGPTGAIHGSALELLFTVEAVDTAELHSKLRDVALVLRDSGGIKFADTSARRGNRELALA